MNVTKAWILGRQTLDKHGLTDWSFQLDKRSQRFGLCTYRTKIISLSAKLTEINDEKEVMDTILHEIAHARAGWAAAHGPVWQQHAIALGAKPKRYMDESAVLPPKRWRGLCPNCKNYSKPRYKRRAGLSCRRCLYLTGKYYHFEWVGINANKA